MGWFSPRNDLQRAVMQAIDRSLAMIEFSTDGTILSANENFCRTMGYALDEIKGRHHGIFLEPGYRDSGEYRDFWGKLQAGQFLEGQFQRVAKAGTPIWLQATYNPILNAAGKPTRIVKLASDITAQKLRDLDATSRIAAIDRAQAVIEFDLDGRIQAANANFLACMGYALDEILGRHHSLFVDPAEADTQAYRDFWAGLRRGEFKQALFHRLGKGGGDVWIEATYNPILGADGKPARVVKFATDVTDRIQADRMMAEVVGRTRETVGAAKANDLTRRVSLDGISGEVHDLATGVNDLIDTVSDVISAVRDASGATLEAARRISTGSNDLAARTEEQAASLEQTAATTEQLSGSVRLSAQASRQGVAIADEAQRVAETGGGIVSEAVEAMSRIEQASKRISDITGVIDEIAFQTNLLALNAAVEAARAGEAGKGFAVVASEVRTLAQRSSEAAKDITGLISTSSAEVATGVRLVRSAGEVLGQMVDASRRVSATIAEISTATSGQAKGIEEMSQAVAHMDEMTQQNASLAEQSAASANALSSQISDLHRFLSDYRTRASDKALPFREVRAARITNAPLRRAG